MTIQNNSDDLFAYLVSQESTGSKIWFGFKQQRITGIYLAYEIAKNHAGTMTPEEVVDYVIKLNNTIYQKMIRADNG